MLENKLPTKKLETIGLALIVLISSFFHFFNLSYPAKAVFDEAHFATYAANIASGKAHFDIHPPLTKSLYALILSFYPPETYKNKLFLETFKNPTTGKIENKPVEEHYNDFPYLPLRILSAFFGILLIIAAHLFIKALTGKIMPALLFAFFIAFENSLLLETRLILLNGFYLTFGLFSLYLYFHPVRGHSPEITTTTASGQSSSSGVRKNSKPLIAGIIWGLALSVKLLALGFLGAIIADFLVSPKTEWRDKLRKMGFFIIAGFLTFLIIFVSLNNFLVPIESRLALYKNLLGDLPDLSGKPKILEYVQATLVEFNLMLSGYTSGVESHPHGSNWYEWPIMKKPITYFPYLSSTNSATEKSLILVGNPFLWALGTAAVIIAVLRLVKKGVQKLGEKKYLAVLLGGYVFSLLPFILFVRRVTFLYHYFPALLFALALVATIFSDEIEKVPKKYEFAILILFLILVGLGFFAVAPYTFGF
jgi:dolichyl-phosphate-mannose--protein O-mannosyl transferase